MLAFLLVTYSILAVFTHALFLFWLLYYFSLTFIFEKRTSLQIDGLPIERPFASILWFLIAIEPRLRAVDLVYAISNASYYETGSKGKSPVELSAKFKSIGWLFCNLAPVPFVYIKHINL